MKKFILITILSLICVASSAQFMNYSTSEFSRKSTAAPSNHFGSIWFSYHPITLTFQEPDIATKKHYTASVPFGPMPMNLVIFRFLSNMGSACNMLLIMKEEAVQGRLLLGPPPIISCL